MKYKYLILLYLVLNILSSSSSLSSNEWYKDTSYNGEEFKSKCDFPIIEFSQLLNNSNIKSSFNYPYIIRNAISDWVIILSIYNILIFYLNTNVNNFLLYIASIQKMGKR